MYIYLDENDDDDNFLIKENAPPFIANGLKIDRYIDVMYRDVMKTNKNTLAFYKDQLKQNKRVLLSSWNWKQ